MVASPARSCVGPVLLLTAGCSSLWSPFDRDQPGNCVQEPGICVTGQVCNQQTQVCEPAPGPLVWRQEAKLTDTDSSGLGLSVALSGDTALSGGETGAAVFVRTGTTWALQSLLSAPSRAKLGAAVALDGDTALVGAYEATLPGKSFAGAAYVYARTGTAWGQPQQLTASNAAANAQYGSAAALSGGVALIGAYAAGTTGAAYIDRGGGGWSEQVMLTVPGANALGISAALDGDTALVGADGRRQGGGVPGAAYVFVLTSGAWTQQAKLAAAAGTPGDEFGQAVALSGDTAVVGAYVEAAAYVYTRTGGEWFQQARLVAADGGTSTSFGVSVALHGDQVLVGAPQAPGAGAGSPGAAYVFARAGSAWTQQVKLTAQDGQDGDGFGRSVALSADTALVGAYPGVTTGAAYVFRLSADPM